MRHIIFLIKIGIVILIGSTITGFFFGHSDFLWWTVWSMGSGLAMLIMEKEGKN